jgi:hypothetical protein
MVLILTAVDVEPNSTRRNDCLGVVHIECCDVTDGKPIARVTIGQTHTALHNSRQSGHIGDLLDCREKPTVSTRYAVVREFAKHQIFQSRVHIEVSRNSHVWHESRPYFVLAVSQLSDKRHLLLVRADGPCIWTRRESEVARLRSTFLWHSTSVEGASW